MYIVSPKRNYYLHSLGFYCMKGNKHMNEEELKQKEQELKDKETDLTAKEEALKRLIFEKPNQQQAHNRPCNDSQYN